MNKENFEIQVVKARISSSAKPKGRVARSPEYKFVGGEEHGYFAPGKVGFDTRQYMHRTVEAASRGLS